MVTIKGGTAILLDRPPHANQLLSDIELRTLARRKFPLARQYRIAFSVGNSSRSTKNAKEKKNRTSWEETFYL